MNAASRWYVVQTRAHAESKACHHLERQGFPTFLPRYLKRRRHAGRVEIVPAPLFPRYLFVLVDIATQQWRSINSTIGVSRLVCNGDEPAPVPSQVVLELQARRDDKGLIPLVEGPRFNRGDKVRVLDGVFGTCVGLFEGITDKERVSILLELLGRKVRVVLDLDVVAAA